MKNLFFVRDCFSSPIIMDAFPEVRIAGASAFYNPVIDATFLPLNSGILRAGLVQKDLISTSMLLEEGHRLLTGTTIMCQMRVVASLIYELILSLIASSESKSQRMSQSEFTSALTAYHHVLDLYISQTRVLQEAYSSFSTVRRLLARDRRSSTKYLRSEYIEEECLAALCGQAGFREFLPVYKQMCYIENRFSRQSYVTGAVRAALRIAWPEELSGEVWDRKEVKPENLVGAIESFFQKEENRPLMRFHQIKDLMDGFPLVGMWNLTDDNLESIIIELQPELASKLRDPCQSRCGCEAMSQFIERCGISDDELTAMTSMLEFSRDIRWQISIAPLNFSEMGKNGLLNQADIAKHGRYHTSFANCLICDDHCFVKEEIYYCGELEKWLLLSSLESIRQQIGEWLPRKLNTGFNIVSPWDVSDLELFGLSESFRRVEIGEKFNLFERAKTAMRSLQDCSER